MDASHRDILKKSDAWIAWDDVADEPSVYDRGPKGPGYVILDGEITLVELKALVAFFESKARA